MVESQLLGYSSRARAHLAEAEAGAVTTERVIGEAGAEMAARTTPSRRSSLACGMVRAWWPRRRNPPKGVALVRARRRHKQANHARIHTTAAYVGAETPVPRGQGQQGSARGRHPRQRPAVATHGTPSSTRLHAHTRWQPASYLASTHATAS